MSAPILQIEGLSVQVGDKLILNHVHLNVAAGTIYAVVGGSGSGKTTAALSVLRLLSPALHVRQGKIIFEGTDLLGLPEEEMRHVRGRQIGMIFQEPLSAFNPVFTIGQQIDEMLACHTPLPPRERRDKILETLRLSGIPDPRRVAGSYPHQLSGGLRQRAMIAQAIVTRPQLILADEPTSSLDVTLQAHIMELLKQLRKDLNLTIVLITHDLNMVAHAADEVTVLHHGMVVETGPTAQVLQNPQNRYTQELMGAFRL